MLMICPKVISNSPEGLQQSLDVIYKHAQEWKLKENIKKSNIIIFSSQCAKKVSFTACHSGKL